MKKLLSIFAFFSILIPLSVFATPVTWDKTTNLLQPLPTSWSDEVRVPYITATSTATSTYTGGIQANILKTTSTTASSTFSNGLNLTKGCFSILNVCLGSGSGSGTISTSTPLVNGQVDFSTGVNTIGNSSNFTWNNASSIFTVASSTGDSAKFYLGTPSGDTNRVLVLDTTYAGSQGPSFFNHSTALNATIEQGMFAGNDSNTGGAFHLSTAGANSNYFLPRSWNIYNDNSGWDGRDFTLDTGDNFYFNPFGGGSTGSDWGIVLGGAGTAPKGLMQFAVDDIPEFDGSHSSNILFNSTQHMVADESFQDIDLENTVYGTMSGGPAAGVVPIQSNVTYAGGNSAFFTSYYNYTGITGGHIDTASGLLVDQPGIDRTASVDTMNGLFVDDQFSPLYVQGALGNSYAIHTNQSASSTSYTMYNEGLGKSYFRGSIGIGTTSPYAPLSVVGQVVGAYYTATTTATSTFAGGVQANILNTTSTTASSTFSNGLNLTKGCFSILNVCLGNGSVTSVGLSDSNSTLTIGGTPVTTSGTLTATLNLAHANTWTALQTINNASTTNITASSFLTIPSSATQSPTIAGQVAHDTTSDQIKYGNGSVTKVLGNGNQYASLTYSTTSAWSATTTIPLGVSYVGDTWNGANCFTDAGTLNMQFYYIQTGTTQVKMNMLACSTATSTQTLSTNNTVPTGAKRYVDVGTPASSPTTISVTISKSITAD